MQQDNDPKHWLKWLKKKDWNQGVAVMQSSPDPNSLWWDPKRPEGTSSFSDKSGATSHWTMGWTWFFITSAFRFSLLLNQWWYMRHVLSIWSSISLISRPAKDQINFIMSWYVKCVSSYVRFTIAWWKLLTQEPLYKRPLKSSGNDQKPLTRIKLKKKQPRPNPKVKPT